MQMRSFKHRIGLASLLFLLWALCQGAVLNGAPPLPPDHPRLKITTHQPKPVIVHVGAVDRNILALEIEAQRTQRSAMQPDTSKGKDRPHGYEEEPWHWSYNPIAKRFTRQYLQKISYEDITDFEGSETASQIDVIKHYVSGINPDCLK
jgi:hypothetical protein